MTGVGVPGPRAETGGGGGNKPWRGAFAERRMTELVRSWDDARTEAFYAGHARQRQTDAGLFAALIVGTADTVVALLRDKHPSRSHPIRDAACDIPVDEAALTVDMRVPYHRLKQHVAAGPQACATVGEAERHAAERAVVDNMKEAYVSVLAPSQLGVGISAADSMLIHGVRLIAEKLGPRAVIVHTDLRNAYNEAWRPTIIQRHIECSPLHPVIPALLASLSTDSYLLVDDRSAPLRSEDGMQQGAPLATTSFCVAIHPEATVGLEVRFDEMHAYIADMEAARREAPADIEWPELDGHHGIAVLNVPLGSPEYGTAILFNQLDAASGMWTVAIPTARTVTTPQELREVAAVYFFLPSPCLAPVVGSHIILPSTKHNPVIVDLYGDALMNLPRPGDAHWRVQNDAIADAFHDHCVHDLGVVRREVDDLFQQAVPLGNTDPGMNSRT
eukprot:jgi/Tetstr1/466584/TSEL_000992.t1